MWEPDPLVEDWKTRRLIRRALAVLGGATWLGCVAFAQWTTAPTPCEQAQAALWSLTWRGELAAELVKQWDDPQCEVVLTDIATTEASGSWTDTLCAALDHVELGPLHALPSSRHATRVSGWQSAHCWRQHSPVGS